MTEPIRYEPHTTNQEDLERIQDRVEDWARQFATSVPALGRYIEGVELAAGVNYVVDHGLGRVPRGWIVCDAEGGFAVVRRVSWDERELVLYGSITTTIALWVF